MERIRGPVARVEAPATVAGGMEDVVGTGAGGGLKGRKLRASSSMSIWRPCGGWPSRWVERAASAVEAEACVTAARRVSCDNGCGDGAEGGAASAAAAFSNVLTAVDRV